MRKNLSATKTVTKYISKNNLIIYESTIYPGCTSEILIPLIEQKLISYSIRIFFVGYSPERINPGLSKYKLENQTKNYKWIK